MTIQQQFETAVGCMYASPMAKLITPGVGRFLVRQWYRWQGEGTKCEAHLFFGDSMTVVLPEVISEVIYTYGFFDEEVTRMVLASVRPGDTVLDVGGHFGYVSLLCRHLLGEKGCLFSFEPTPSTYSILAENLSRFPNAEAVNAGVGSEPGVMTIHDFGLRYCAWNTLTGGSRLPSVLAGVTPLEHLTRIVRLDDFVTERNIAPDFIKVDAENFEHAVISGGMEVIKRYKPTLLLETGSLSSLQACELLHACGYTIRICEAGGNVQLWRGSLAEANVSFKDLLFVHLDRV